MKSLKLLPLVAALLLPLASQGQPLTITRFETTAVACAGWDGSYNAVSSTNLNPFHLTQQSIDDYGSNASGEFDSYGTLSGNTLSVTANADCFISSGGFNGPEPCWAGSAVQVEFTTYSPSYYSVVAVLSRNTTPDDIILHIDYTSVSLGHPLDTNYAFECNINGHDNDRIAGNTSGALPAGSWSFMAVCDLECTVMLPPSSYSASNDLQLMFTVSQSNILSTTVSGRITDACSGLPITNASVQIGFLTALSDSGGNYSISNVPSGTYTAIISQTNYYTTNTTVTISSASTTVTKDFWLTPQFMITNHVYCACPVTPITNASVQIGNYSATTDSAGQYAITNILPGTYAATVTKPGYYSTNVTFSIPQNSPAASPDFFLIPANTIAFYHEPAIRVCVGHVFVALTFATGERYVRGFYPDGFILEGPGIIVPDTSTPWDWGISYPITKSQATEALRTIAHDSLSTPWYTLTAFNCMAWAAKVAAAANVVLPPYSWSSYVLPAPIPCDSVFRDSLAQLGLGGQFNCGTVIQNSGTLTAEDVYPYDYSYTALENAGHSNASSLAADLGLAFDHINLGSINANVANGPTITLAGLTSEQALISMNWGDSSVLHEQSLTMSHVFSNGTYLVDLLIIDNGAVHSYDMKVIVSDAIGSVTKLNVTSYPALRILNQGFVSAPPVTGYPPPFAKSISILSNGHASITFTGAANETYVIQSTTNLNRSFSTITNITSTTNGVFIYKDPNTPNNSSTFYRALWP